MKVTGIFMAVCFTILLAQQTQAQSTTGGRSGGSTASTGTGYETSGRRPAETSASSMTVADEGSQRGYLFIPPTPKPNRAASPDGTQPTKSLNRKAATTDTLPARRKSTKRQQR
ncbi:MULTISPECIES: hypothetical protein [unclassified Spirosoma]|uniref:hypothetical protein n=1 Tax=unclassified Spirosoma TaxID=2621999 RepID=UPI000967A49E|nr:MULTISPECIES: hypothetical protein [unclassified Spirosoma]MBN8825669.1 hypothetical protein [Spirosoma sp.]OJW71634.1 MAG: hypothetical protein BGO59_27060 [Spirosoma sp. 48-14]